MVRFFHFFFVLFFLSQSVRSETRRYAAYPPSSVVKANFGARFKFENTRRWLVEPGPRGALTLRHWVLLWLQSISFFSLVIIKNDQDNIISFDVEREFDYQWGFGRQKGPRFYTLKFISCRTVENSGKSNFDGLFECTNNEGDNLSLCDTALTIGRVCSGKKVPRDYGWNYYALSVWIRRFVAEI